jgi:acyl dehydratase
VPLSPDLVGRSIEPLAHEVDARWLMAYAAGIGDSHERYLDTTRAEGIEAHPLFHVCLEWPAMLALRAEVADVIERAERLRGVHATEDLTLHRPIVAGDRLHTSAVIVSVEARTPGAYEVVRFDTFDDDEQPVATSYMGSLFLGVDLDGDDRVDDAPAPRPDVSGPDDAATETSELWLAATAAHVYTECARIWNPIHTDAAVARAAHLPGIILHGTATLAMAVSAALESPFGPQPSQVRRVVARFGAMVPLPSRLNVTSGTDRADPALRHVEVRNQTGDLVLRDGLLVTNVS